MLIKDVRSRGDTIIEVLFAITVFSLVVVGSLAIMNQGSATAQRTLEISLVRQQIDAQAETLRFLNASYIATYKSGVDTTQAEQWQLIQGGVADSATDFAAVGNRCPNALTPIPKSFILNTHSATYVAPSSGKMKSSVTFAQVQYDAGNQVTEAQGIWIEAVHSELSPDLNQSNTGYIDFNIRACWDSPGQDVPVTLGTIVRLYEPRG